MQDEYQALQRPNGLPMRPVSTVLPQQSSSFHLPAPNATPRVVSLSNPALGSLNPGMGGYGPLTSGSARSQSFISPNPDRLSFYRHVPQHSGTFLPSQSSASNSQMDYFTEESIQSPIAYYPRVLSGPLKDSQFSPPQRSQRSLDAASSSPSSGDISSRPPLPPKHFHYSESLTADDMAWLPPSRPAPPPPLPPKYAFPASPTSLFGTSHDIARSSNSDDSSASRHPRPSPDHEPSPPAYAPSSKDAKGETENEDLTRAPVLSKAHYDQTAKKNSQLLEEHLSPLSPGDAYDEPLIIREEEESENTPVDDDDDELYRAIEESLRIAELGSSQSTGHGWEPYDPSAFEDLPISSIQPSPEPLTPPVALAILAQGISESHTSHHATNSALPSPSMQTSAPGSPLPGPPTSRGEETHTPAVLDSAPLVPSSDLEPNNRVFEIAPGLRTSASVNSLAVLAQPTASLRTSPSTLLPPGGPMRMRTGSFHVAPPEVRDGGKDVAREDPGAPIVTKRGSGDRELQRTKSVGDIPAPVYRDAVPPPPLPSMAFIGDLMNGVSFGFGRALILPKTAVPDPSKPFPEIVSLGTGEAFFIATPTFRQLLRLLASLGHASIEPKLQAYATTDAAGLSLRPTLQFVATMLPKEFATILWLEIAIPQPRSELSAAQRTHGDTARRGWRTALPESVQHRPVLGSHVYTCQDPLPVLPRMLPDLASYLQMLLRESRRASDSAGLRRLSKIVDLIYKKDDGDEEIGGQAPVAGVPGSSRRITDMLSRVIPRQKRKHAGSGANEEMYDLVTPFRLD